MAIAINLCTVGSFVKELNDDDGLRHIMKRAIKTRDPLVFKMLYNISQHDDISIKLRFLDCIDEFMNIMVKSTNDPEILVEILGILGNLLIPDFDFVKLAQTFSLFEFLAHIINSCIRDGKTTESEGIDENDDILLRAIIVVGTMSLDEAVPPLVAKSKLLQLLVDTLMIKEEDDEIILQVCYCIYQYLHHESTCKLLIGLSRTYSFDVDVVDYLIDLLYDRNLEIRKICDASLSIIAVY
jgi:hypothetical protein